MTDRSIPIELDKVRHLRYTFNDIADIEDALDMYFPDIIAAGFSFKITRALLWGGLKGEDKSLRQRPAGLLKVGEIIEEWIKEGGKLPDLYEQCGKGLVAAGIFGKGEPSSDEASPES
jgi:hypothetical protein